MTLDDWLGRIEQLHHRTIDLSLDQAYQPKYFLFLWIFRRRFFPFQPPLEALVKQDFGLERNSRVIQVIVGIRVEQAICKHGWRQRDR